MKNLFTVFINEKDRTAIIRRDGFKKSLSFESGDEWQEFLGENGEIYDTHYLEEEGEPTHVSVYSTYIAENGDRQTNTSDCLTKESVVINK